MRPKGQRDGVLGADGDTGAAAFAGLGPHDTHLARAVCQRLQLAEKAEGAAFFAAQGTHRQHVARAGRDARTFAFTAIAIDDGRHAAGRVAAECAGWQLGHGNSGVDD